MKIAVILGTRPEIIKMSPIIRELSNKRNDYFIVHTGQHYSYNMDRVFFEQLRLPDAKHNLEVGSGYHGEQTAKILNGIEKVLMLEKPEVVLVQGDTNTVLAGALGASKLHIKIGHVEAGLRSYDRQMPEEINRILTDHCADYLFTPTEKAQNILISEGIARNKIFNTGNTIVDAVYQNLEIANESGNILNKLNLQSKNYFLVTMHRQENVDDPVRFGRVLQALNKLNSLYHMPIIFPIHPRSRKMMGNFDLKPENITLVEPVDFFGFLQLEKHARLILTDSGGVQEESCILGTPCVTLRENTERPETLEVGANMLAGTDLEKILKYSEQMLKMGNSWRNPFGDGTAGKKIIAIISGGNNE
jgi:UDP-N-acetylglucosamine 2-epimerase (non-hydrolysing)